MVSGITFIFLFSCLTAKWDSRWLWLTSQEFWSRLLFRTPFLAASPCYGGEQCDPKKVCSVAQFGCRIPHTLKESDHIEPSRLCAGPQLQLPVFPHLLLRRSHIATGLLYDLHICACCECVLLIKMTCAENWIIVRERRAVNLTPSSWPSWIQRQDSVRTSVAKLGCSGWPWLLLCLVMLSMLHNMLLHCHLGRWITVMISSAPAAEADFT